MDYFIIYPPLVSIFAIHAKVCVAIFVILSGYGLTKSFEKNGVSRVLFIYKHFVKLFCRYWFIFIVFVPMGFIFGRNPIEIWGGVGFKGLIKCIIDFMGLANIFGTPTMNATWWYMGAIIILYLMFPFLVSAVKKNCHISLTISAAICFFGEITGRWYHAVLAWIFPFVTGIYLAQKGVLDKIANTKYKYRVSIISLICIFGLAVLRCIFDVLSIKIDTVFGLSIIIFSLAFLSNIKYINIILEFIGVHSANIFMMHTFFYSYYFKDIIYAPYYTFLILLNLIITSILASVGIEKLKKVLSYEKFIKWLLSIGGKIA